MNVLIADKFEPSGIDALRGAGCHVTVDANLKDTALLGAVTRLEPRVLVVRSTRVTEAVLQATPALSVVVRAGAGVNAIDLAAASRQSVLVANCPGRNAVAVAELTFALILSLDRRVVDATADLRAGAWNKKEYAKARGLKGRTLGIVGMGTIGRAVATRALGFEMNVVAWSRSLTSASADEFGVSCCESPGEVASKCDILTIHLAASPETKGIIGANVFDRLKPGSFVINTARADLVDYGALTAAVGKLGLRVGLDVFPDEPASGQAEFSSEIIGADGVVYGTPHIGASTDQAQAAIADETVGIITDYLRTGRVRNCVNLCDKTPAKYIMIVRHRNRPGVLAHILHAISHAGVNVSEMENLLCAGAESACAQIKLDGDLSPDVLREIKEGNEHIFGVTFGALTSR